mmetsp:Transcript_15210/g.33099  ORF Transcript_15210/g.33099 Transcript_15210/m.33099 type:complete len:250 (+) Transcript_15210:1323-2072(+)
MLVNDSCTFILSLSFLKRGKLLKYSGLAALLRLQLDQGALKHSPCQSYVLGFKLGPLGKPKKAPRRGVRIDVPSHDGLGSVGLTAASLEPRIRKPRTIVRHPLHPPLEYGPALGHVPHHFFHVHVLVPKKVDAGQDLDRSVQHVPGPVDEFIAHLKLGVAQPKLRRAMLHLKGPLKDRPGTFVFLIVLLELGILDPIPDMLPTVADVILEVLAPIAEEGLVLLRVVDLGYGIELMLLLPFCRLAEDLLG